MNFNKINKLNTINPFDILIKNLDTYIFDILLMSIFFFISRLNIDYIESLFDY